MRGISTEKFQAITTNAFKRIFLKRKINTNSPSSKGMTIKFEVDFFSIIFSSAHLFFVYYNRVGMYNRFVSKNKTSKNLTGVGFAKIGQLSVIIVS